MDPQRQYPIISLLNKEILDSTAITERLLIVLKWLFILLFILYLIFNYNSQSFNYVLNFSILQFNVVPVKPLINYNDLSNTNFLRKELKNKAGVYGIINTKSSKQYIGSSLNLYDRLMDHIKGRDSNLRLQRSIKKYGLDSFKIVIYYSYNCFWISSYYSKISFLLCQFNSKNKCNRF